VAVVYAVVAGVWIAASDGLLGSWISDPAALTRAQTWKGWAFVAFSALLIFVMVRGAIRATRESERRFRSVVDQTLVGVYIIRDGRFRYVNERLAEVFGYAVEELRDRPVLDVVHPSDRARVAETLRRRETGEVASGRYELRGLRRDDREVVVEVFGRRVLLDAGPAVMGVLVDRTEARRLEDQMHQAQRMEAVGQLTGAVSHDFNNLLTAIIGPLDLALADPQMDPGLREELAQVRAAAMRASELTAKLLAFSRKEARNPAVLDLEDRVSVLAPLLERVVPRGVRLELDLGPATAPVRIDPSALEQILLNLAVNAAEAMPEGGTVTVSTGTRSVKAHDPSLPPQPEGATLPPGPYRLLRVSDTGHGMDRPTRRRVFEPFFTTKEEGTGLGLATVFGETTKAGGAVLLDSEPGRGATFTVLLPAAAGEEGGMDRAGPASRAAGTGGRVLVVEDEEEVGRVVVAALRRFGFEAARATTLAEARAAVRKGPGPDLLLTDVVLPDGTGAELAREVAGAREGMRVLFMTGHAGETVAEDPHVPDIPGEGVPVLEKPFTLEALRASVESSLRGPPWSSAEGRVPTAPRRASGGG
jgi:PAS domain S-box-containing protein